VNHIYDMMMAIYNFFFGKNIYDGNSAHTDFCSPFSLRLKVSLLIKYCFTDHKHLLHILVILVSVRGCRPDTCMLSLFLIM
jgi:hypothetical protein